MNQDEKIRVAITSGVVGIMLLLLVLYVSIAGSDGTNNVLQKELLETNSAASVFSDAAVAASDSTAENLTVADASDTDKSVASTDTGKDNSAAVLGASKTPSISGNCFYETKEPRLQSKYSGVSYDVSTQLQELTRYWKEGNQAAIRDLVHLPRFEAMSAALTGTKDFYYLGEAGADGLPEGFGVAVYADSQYYFGQWSQGKRNGEGTWFSFYPDYDQYAVKEHMYAGTFKDDLPNGHGQEHFDYNAEYMNEYDLYLQNVIGSFENGSYNGQMYVITVDMNSHTREWDGTCTKGTWQVVSGGTKDSQGRSPVLSQRDNPENHVWLVESKLAGNKVSGIIYGGSRKQ